MAAFNYRGFYERLISRAKNRILDGYVERHHIKPRCLGGSDNRSNIVQLTAEEHYVAHQLLVKMFADNFGLLWSAMAMTNATGKMHRSNKRYGWLRRRFALSVAMRLRGIKRSPESRAKMSAARLGRKFGPRPVEVRAAIAAGNKGKPKSAAHRSALAQAKIGNKNRLGGKKYILATQGE